MRVGEAFEKVSEEMARSLMDKLGVGPDVGLGEIDIRDLQDLSLGSDHIEPYLYDGSTKDFISSRSRRIAESMIKQAEESGFDFARLVEDFGLLTDDLPSKWHLDLVKIFAMGYSFAAPEFADVPHDKDGFLRLCREVDQDMIAIQVSQFSQDESLRDQLVRRLVNAGELVSQAFSAQRRPVTKFVMRDWFFQVFATVALNCFIGGHKVRDLLEQEVAFEAMMKETD